jgi:hypothetical protein
VISRRLKVKPTKALEAKLNGQLFQYAGLYNWAVRKLWADVHGGIFYSRYDLYALVNGHAAKCGLNLETMRRILDRAMNAHRTRHSRRFPARLKSKRNRLNSIPLPQRVGWVDRTHIQVPGIGAVLAHEMAGDRLSETSYVMGKPRPAGADYREPEP